MRLIILLFLFSVLQQIGITADLSSPVPLTDSAYTELRQLDRWGILADGQNQLLSEKEQHVLTRYDIALLLVEPFERCAALVEVPDSTKVLPAQRRRWEMAYLTVSKLSTADVDHMLATVSTLLRDFAGDVDLLAPKLSQRTSEALRKLKLSPSYRPWMTVPEQTNNLPLIHITINPHAPSDSLHNPLLFLTSPQGGREALFMRRSGATREMSDPLLVGSRNVTTMEAAIDVAFSRFRLYGSLSSLPGSDPAQIMIRPDGSGSAMLGIEVNLTHINDLGISGIFEYHITRLGVPDSYNTNVGIGGGIGLSW